DFHDHVFDTVSQPLGPVGVAVDTRQRRKRVQPVRGDTTPRPARGDRLGDLATGVRVERVGDFQLERTGELVPNLLSEVAPFRTGRYDVHAVGQASLRNPGH